MHIEGYGHGYPFEEKGRVGHPSLFRITAIQDGTWEPDYSKWTRWNFAEYLEEFQFYMLLPPVDMLAAAEAHGIIFDLI